MVVFFHVLGFAMITALGLQKWIKGNLGLLGQGSAYFFYIKGQVVRILGSALVPSVRENHSTLFCRQSSHVVNVNEQVWLSSNKTSRTLRLELNMICTCHEILIFPPALEHLTRKDRSSFDCHRETGRRHLS